MRYHIMKKDDIYLRRAMWESYKKKCVYCGIFIEPREMEIDHIFPTKDVEINKSTDKDYSKYIEELKEDNFEINSIENYIITCGDCNRKKLNYAFETSNFRFYHDFANRHVQDILKRIERIKKGINVSDFDKQEVSGLEKQEEFQTKKYDEEDLKCSLKVLNAGKVCSFHYGLGNVRIDAYLPVDYEDKMSCQISFIEVYQSDIFLTYEEENIKKYLFSGYKTLFNSKERRWCMFYEHLKDDSIYRIILPNVQLNVSKETLRQMAIICDSLYEEYMIQIENINNILGVSEFIEVDKNLWKLFKINERTRYVLYDFMESHQYDQDLNDEYNIFHIISLPDRFYLQKNFNSNQEGEIHAYIEFRQNGSYYDVLWSPGYIGNEVDKMNNFDDIKKWTAEYTHDWFINKCIPYAMNENLKKSETRLQRIFKRNEIEYTTEQLFADKSIISYRTDK